MNKLVCQRIPVFGPNTPTHLPADSHVPYAEAKRLVVQGVARFINKCRAIRLLSKDPAPKVRDISCKVGENVIHDYIQEKTYAQEIVKAWDPTIARRDLIVKRAASSEPSFAY